jgi:hypothetical protein
MSATPNSWDELAELWCAGEEDPIAGWLHRMAAARRRRLSLAAVGEAALVVVFALLSALVVRRGVEAWSAVWLATLWVFTAVALLFGWWNRRGLWRALGDDVEAYVRFLRLRATRQLRAARFGLGLLVAEVVVVMAQLVGFHRLSPLVAFVLAGVSASILAVCLWAARQARGELALLAEIAGQPSAAPPAAR